MIPFIHRGRCYQYFEKTFPELIEEIKKNTDFLDIKPNVTLGERLYCILNDIYNVKMCKVCNNKYAIFRNFHKGYSDCCSFKCASKNPDRIIKIQNTNKKLYGCVCSLQSESSMKKKKETWMKNYGVDHPSKS